MKNILRQSTKAFFVLLLCTSALWAQKLTLTGIVRDGDGTPLEMAKVVAINQATKA